MPKIERLKKSGEETILTTFRMTVPMWQAAKVMAIAERRSLQDLITRGVQRVLKEREEQRARAGGEVAEMP
jgi:hypothetical protein